MDAILSEFVLADPNIIVRTVVVGVLAYVSLIVILRISGKRTLSQMNAFDFVVTVALGSTLATILLSKDVSLVEGVAALGLLVLLQFVITWTSQRSRTVARMVKSEPAAVLYRGRVLHDAMSRERLLEAELHAALRQAGIATEREVDLVVLETDGVISIIRELPPEPTAIAGVNNLPEEALPDTERDKTGPDRGDSGSGDSAQS